MMEQDKQQYKMVQFIAYQLNTQARINVLPTLLANASLQADIDCRFQMVFEIMKFCRSQLKEDQDSTLKIFVTPESYGRAVKGESSGKGHYSISDVWNAFMALKNAVQTDKGFNHWLVIPGTSITATPGAKDYQIFNSVYAFTGDGNTKTEHIMNKLSFAGADNLLESARGSDQGYNEVYQKFNPSIASIIKPAPIIEVGNLKLGIEICQDFVNGRLRRFLQTGQVGEINVAQGVDVQIITACGIDIPDSKNNIATKQGGHIFHVDGDPNMKTLIECLTVEWTSETMAKDKAGYTTAGNPATDLPTGLQIRSQEPPKPSKFGKPTIIAPSQYAIFPPVPIPPPAK